MERGGAGARVPVRAGPAGPHGVPVPGGEGSPPGAGSVRRQPQPSVGYPTSSVVLVPSAAVAVTVAVPASIDVARLLNAW